MACLPTHTSLLFPTFLLSSQILQRKRKHWVLWWWCETGCLIVVLVLCLLFDERQEQENRKRKKRTRATKARRCTFLAPGFDWSCLVLLLFPWCAEALRAALSVAFLPAGAGLQNALIHAHLPRSTFILARTARRTALARLRRVRAYVLPFTKFWGGRRRRDDNNLSSPIPPLRRRHCSLVHWCGVLAVLAPVWRARITFHEHATFFFLTTALHLSLHAHALTRLPHTAIASESA